MTFLDFLSSFFLMGYAVNIAVALPIPLSFRPSPSGLPYTHLVASLEFIFYCIFTTALLFSILGTYVLWLLGEARTPTDVGILSRGATLFMAIRRPRLPAFPTGTALDNAGQIAQRRVPIRTGGVSYPVSAAPRRLGETSQRPSRLQPRS
ncbi:hypothetical protein BGW80DRAFT_1328331 [Lactifluus volemus]|nr:hypothetical protein BGW80DRAFT_1328331 [Lactifluus volemus]